MEEKYEKQLGDNGFVTAIEVEKQGCPILLSAELEAKVMKQIQHEGKSGERITYKSAFSLVQAAQEYEQQCMKENHWEALCSESTKET